MNKTKYIWLLMTGVVRSFFTPLRRNKPVLQDWVMELEYKQQTTLLSCIRGSDNECATAKNITKMIRYATLINADKSTKFMCDKVLPATKVIRYLKKEHKNNPHWVEHIVWAGFILGKSYPNPYARRYWMSVTGTVNHAINEQKKKLKERREKEDKVRTELGENLAKAVSKKMEDTLFNGLDTSEDPFSHESIVVETLPTKNEEVKVSTLPTGL